MPTVRSVTTASTAVGSRQKSSALMSAKTGVAPVSATDAGGQQAEVQARGAGVDGDAGAAEAEVGAELLLERLDLRALREHPAAQDAVDRLALLVADERLGGRDELAGRRAGGLGHGGQASVRVSLFSR